jgi:carboxymethylenebutenolidase
MGDTIELVAEDGFRISAYEAKAEGKRRGGLVVAQEIFGVNSHIRSVCDRYAKDGYDVIAPALFDRYERGVEIGYGADDIARGRELKAKATNDAALLDAGAARDALSASGKVGIVGYCWGGSIAWLSACRLSDFACAIAYYGGGMLEAIGETPKCPVMAHFGERDAGIPIDGVRRFAAAHPEVQVFVYAADHGFNCDQRGSYDAPSAALARERSLEHLRRHLG